MTQKDIKLSDVMALAEFAKQHEIDPKRAIRFARNGEFPGAFQFANRWVICKDAIVPKLPAPGTRRTALREDGRSGFKVFLAPDEFNTVVMLVGHENVIDPREVARQRRAARKAVVEAEVEVPF